jgi:hypothetical protein
MIYAADKLSTFSKYKVSKIADIVGKFCVENLGKKRNRSYPTILLSYVKDPEFMGEYCSDEHIVIVYVNKCKTISELTTTIIHEWTHSKQNIIGQYSKLYKKFGYDEHPMEVEAYASEKIWNRKCLNFLRKNI